MSSKNWRNLLGCFFVVLLILQACSPRVTASIRMIGNKGCSLTIGAWVFKAYCRRGAWR